MKGLIPISFCALRIMLVCFMSIMDLKVLKLILDFTCQHSFQRFKPGFGVRLDSFPFSALRCRLRSRNLVSRIGKVVSSVEWVYPSCLHAW